MLCQFDLVYCLIILLLVICLLLVIVICICVNFVRAGQCYINSDLVRLLEDGHSGEQALLCKLNKFATKGYL